jgi:hypothetical protein
VQTVAVAAAAEVVVNPEVVHTSSEPFSEDVGAEVVAWKWCWG